MKKWIFSLGFFLTASVHAENVIKICEGMFTSFLHDISSPKIKVPDIFWRKINGKPLKQAPLDLDQPRFTKVSTQIVEVLPLQPALRVMSFVRKQVAIHWDEKNFKIRTAFSRARYSESDIAEIIKWTDREHFTLYIDRSSPGDIVIEYVLGNAYLPPAKIDQIAQQAMGRIDEVLLRIKYL